MRFPVETQKRKLSEGIVYKWAKWATSENCSAKGRAGKKRTRKSEEQRQTWEEQRTASPACNKELRTENHRDGASDWEKGEGNQRKTDHSQMACCGAPHPSMGALFSQ